MTCLASNYIVFNNNDKKRVVVEMLWSLFQTDFDNPKINKKISEKLDILDLVYEIVN